MNNMNSTIINVLDNTSKPRNSRRVAKGWQLNLEALGGPDGVVELCRAVANEIEIEHENNVFSPTQLERGDNKKFVSTVNKKGETINVPATVSNLNQFGRSLALSAMGYHVELVERGPDALDAMAKRLGRDINEDATALQAIVRVFSGDKVIETNSVSMAIVEDGVSEAYTMNQQLYRGRPVWRRHVTEARYAKLQESSGVQHTGKYAFLAMQEHYDHVRVIVSEGQTEKEARKQVARLMLGEILYKAGFTDEEERNAIVNSL